MSELIIAAAGTGILVLIRRWKTIPFPTMPTIALMQRRLAIWLIVRAIGREARTNAMILGKGMAVRGVHAISPPLCGTTAYLHAQNREGGSNG